MKAVALAAAAVAITLTGCANRLASNEYEVHFETIPSGALIYESGKAIGIAPISGTIKLSRDDMAKSLITNEFTVVWPSGARLVQKKDWSPQTHRRWRFRFDRPQNAPGLDIDLRHATALDAVAAQQREAAAASNREAARAFLEGLAAGQRSRGSSLCIANRVSKDTALVSCD